MLNGMMVRVMFKLHVVVSVSEACGADQSGLALVRAFIISAGLRGVGLGSYYCCDCGPDHSTRAELHVTCNHRMTRSTDTATLPSNHVTNGERWRALALLSAHVQLYHDMPGLEQSVFRRNVKSNVNL